MKRLNYIYIFLCFLIVFLLSLGWISVFKLYKVVSTLNVESYKQYNILEEGITYYLPSNFQVNELAFNDGEILYHADFKSQDKNIWGFVEVMNIGKDLKGYLEKSKNSAVGVVDFKYFNIYNIKVGNKDGYRLEYSRKGNDNRYYRAQEYFIPNSKGHVFRMSFFMREDLFNSKFFNLFEEIVNKTKINWGVFYGQRTKEEVCKEKIYVCI